MGMPASSWTYIRNVSYDTIRQGLVTARPVAEAHCRICIVNSSLLALPSTANALIASGPSHFVNSFAQFFTNEDGQATTHFWIVPFPASGDCFSSVHMSAMHCNVLPRPISSAMMHPCAFSSISPVVHRYMNLTPST